MDWTLDESALSINKGNSEPSAVNPNYVRRKPKLPKREELVESILEGGRSALSQAITLVESSRKDHRQLAGHLIDELMPHTGKSFRIGITGVPGVGKSSFIESFGMHLLENPENRIAVLAVDPSSGKSGGSILGDKTRMEMLSNHPRAYVRPSPSACSLGGVARRTREAMLLCEAAGFNMILVETVGVGQSETAVKGMVDFFLLLLLAGAGDELQGIKRGIMEMADGIAINKCDGENIPNAERAKGEVEAAMHLFPPSKNGWYPKTLTCSAVEKTGLDEIYKMLQLFGDDQKRLGHWITNRSQQLESWLKESLEQDLLDSFYQSEGVNDAMTEAIKRVTHGEVSPFEAGRQLLEFWKR